MRPRWLGLDHAAARGARRPSSELRELARAGHPSRLILTDTGPPARPSTPLAARSTAAAEVARPRRGPAPPAGRRGREPSYFVVTEALANVAKYSQAAPTAIRSRPTGPPVSSRRVEVADDGVGGADPSSGTGLRGLADRLESINGSLEVRSPIGGGTRLLARIPVSAAELVPA